MNSPATPWAPRRGSPLRLAAWLPVVWRACPTNSWIPRDARATTGSRFLGDFAEYEEGEFKSRFSLATRHIRDTGVSYRIYGEENERSWPINPLPLILGEGEWAQIAAGVEQRANLMEALLQDFYGEGNLLADGALPAAAVTGSNDFIRAMRGGQAARRALFCNFTPPTLAADRTDAGGYWTTVPRPPPAPAMRLKTASCSRAPIPLYNAMNVTAPRPVLRRAAQGPCRRRRPERPANLSPHARPIQPRPISSRPILRAISAFCWSKATTSWSAHGRAYVRTIAGLKRADVISATRVDADFVDPLELNSALAARCAGLARMRSATASVAVAQHALAPGSLESKALLGSCRNSAAPVASAKS